MTVLSGSYTDFVERSFVLCIILYHVGFVESVTGAVQRFFHILGHSVVGQSRSICMLRAFVSLFIRMTIVSYMRRLYVQFQFCPAVPCRQSSSPVSAVIQGRRYSFPVGRILARLQKFPFV